jgi:hypothetical protein
MNPKGTPRAIELRYEGRYGTVFVTTGLIDGPAGRNDEYRT